MLSAVGVPYSLPQLQSLGEEAVIPHDNSQPLSNAAAAAADDIRLADAAGSTASGPIASFDLPDFPAGTRNKAFPSAAPLPATDAEQQNVSRGDLLPPHLLDLVFADTNRIHNVRIPASSRPPRPVFSDPTGDESTEQMFDSSVERAEQILMADAGPADRAVASDPGANDRAVRLHSVQPDGFVEIPRSAVTRSEIRRSLHDNPESDVAGRRPASEQPPFAPLDDEQPPASNDDDSAVQAALEFFNRQTEGGFVDAGLDELHAAAAISDAVGASPARTVLEAGVGRMNPFDERSHTTKLTAVELRDFAETDARRDFELNSGSEVALAVMGLGAVGWRTRLFVRIAASARRLTRRLTRRLRSFLGFSQ